MDDIAGLKWTSTPATNKHTPAPLTSNYSAFSSLKPTPPTSGRASPLNQPSSHPPSKSTTPANDSFANLVGFNSSGGGNKNLSLQEQQKILLESKLKQQQANTQKIQTQYAGGDDQFWNNLGSGRGIPAPESQAPSGANPSAANGANGANDEEDDLFAAFNKPAAVPKGPAATPSPEVTTNNVDEDDPFELSSFSDRRTNTGETTTTVDDEDDVLGLLGKPASARPRPPSPRRVVREERANDHPQDKAVAELVDMGFPADRAKQALETTESGLDVQAAVGYLLNQAHSDAQSKARSRNAHRQEEAHEDGGRGHSHQEARANPSRWRPAEEEHIRPRDREQARGQEKDFEQMASEFGSTFLKTAGSFWKQSTKRVQQAVQEFNSEGEAGGAPKWMREAEGQSTNPQPSQKQQLEDEHAHMRPRHRPTTQTRQAPEATDEALMLESSRPTPPPRPSRATPHQRPGPEPALHHSRDHSPAVPSRLREPSPTQQPAFLRQQTQSPPLNPRATLSRHAAEEQAAQAYVSSARRRKPQPQAPAGPPAAVGGDLLDGGFKDTSAAPPRSTPTAGPPRPQSQPVRRVETPVRPPAPPRNIPSLSAIALKAVHTHREKGNEHFKRGDYSSAHQSYGTSITHLPESHPLIIVLLTNRSLTALKVGEPKNAITDADKAIAVIGVSKGESETIDFGTGDSPKAMREYYGKALMRKAEALEQMEKWPEAATVWREAVEGGHGGATAIQGRARAEKATNPITTTRPTPVSTPRPREAPASTPAATTATSNRAAAAAQKAAAQAQAAAVSRLRAANAAADRVDDERFQLGDRVDARIQAWKGGKEANLRALLGSLENALWEGSGWKKISMADLVLPGKVKIQYMKGIAKVHPDKVCVKPPPQSNLNSMIPPGSFVVGWLLCISSPRIKSRMHVVLYYIQILSIEN